MTNDGKLRVDVEEFLYALQPLGMHRYHDPNSQVDIMVRPATHGRARTLVETSSSVIEPHNT